MKAFYVMFVVFAVLLLGAPMASAQDSWPGCPWGNTYSPTEHGFIAECFWRPTDNGAAIKPAGLAKPAPAAIPVQGLPCLPWDDAYDPQTMLSRGPECVSQPADNSAASKTAGLAKLTPVEGVVSCGFNEQLDPLLDPQALACLSQSIPAAKAASKPAGLAAPAPAVIPEQGLPCLLWGNADDLMMMLSHGPECVGQPADNTAASKTAGLARLAPMEASAACGFSEQLDPLLDPQALACPSQSIPAAKAASKPAGLAAPAPAQIKFGPCGASGESPDPLTLACLR